MVETRANRGIQATKAHHAPAGCLREDGIMALSPDDSQLTPEQIRTFWLQTADAVTWDLAPDAPSWLTQECVEMGLAFETASGVWRKTLKGDWMAGRKVG